MSGMGTWVRRGRGHYNAPSPHASVSHLYTACSCQSREEGQGGMGGVCPSQTQE